MNNPNDSTPANLPGDISISDLGKLVGGEETSAPVIPVAEPETHAAEPVKAEPGAPEAAAVETPATEPEKKAEAEEKPADKQQETPNTKEGKESWIDRRLRISARRRDKAEALAQQAESDKRVERERADRLERELEALKKGQPGPAAEPVAEPKAGEKKPVLKDFVKEDGDYDEAVEQYFEARAAWERKQESDQRARDQQAASAASQKSAFLKDWQQALEEHPDFEDAVAEVRSNTPDGLQVALSQLRDDDGAALWPKLTMHLADHPDTMAALSKQFGENPIAATARLGRIAASLIPTKVAEPPKPAVQQAAPKTAAKPPAVVGGTSAPAVIDLEKADMATFAREVQKYL